MLSIALMFIDQRYDYLRGFRYYFDTASYAIYYMANLPVHAWNQIYHASTNYEILKAENKDLRVKNALLSSELQKSFILKSENKRLKNLFKITGGRIQNIVIAELVAKNATPFKQRIVINKGSRDNAYVGQTILGATGILGQIISVTPISATGMLISDPAHAMLTQVKRSQIYVLATGTGNPNQIRLQYVPSDTDIREGDTLVSSGLDELYPPDYPVGKVVEVIRSDDDAFATIFATPFAQLNQGREVLLITDKKASARKPIEITPQQPVPKDLLQQAIEKQNEEDASQQPQSTIQAITREEQAEE